MTLPRSLSLAAAVIALLAGPAAARPAALEGVPRYAHIFVIVLENKDYGQILGGTLAPHIDRLAHAYGEAARFYSEVHPSEANYVALLGGDTFGMHDDDGFLCKPGMVDPGCPGAAHQAGYPDHTVHAPHLGDQLAAAGLTWKGYYESLPAPGALVYTAGDPRIDDGSKPMAVYASKHSGFLNFASVQGDPARAVHIVGFDILAADLAKNKLPNFALIVPNQCNEMHGLHGGGVPADCDAANTDGLIRRGDAEVGRLVGEIMATSGWRSKTNSAIVITFDEGSGRTREGCCAVTPDAPSNYGGGHIPTIVITNHGPRGLKDETPYNHYSLLRTMEDAFGISEHLAHAADTDKGVVAMRPLFAVR